MKKIFKLLLIATLIFFLQLISTKNYVFAQSFDCNWNIYVGACIPPSGLDPCGGAATQCYRNCTQFNIGNCPGSHPCNCPTPTAQPAPTSAQLNLPALYGAIQSAGAPLNFLSTPGGIISDILNYIIPIAGLILLIFLIVGGFKFMTSAGDPKAAQSAKGTITTALVGFVIIFLAYWITKIAAIVLGLGNISSIF